MSDDIDRKRMAFYDGLAAQLQWLRLTHTPGLPAAPPAPPVHEVEEIRAMPSSPAVEAAPLAALGEPNAALHTSNAQHGDAQQDLQVIRNDLGDCQRCKLHSGRNKIVFGQGNPRADLVFVGEGPGAEEDRQGEAFVGKAGELLTKMIGAMGYSRDEVYICNIIKCRPPRNRDPQPDEVAACEPFLIRQLDVLQPKVIVCLGKYAAQTLLNTKSPISRLRGSWASYQGIDLMPTFHPAYLLRNSSAKRPVWDDLKEVMRRLGKDPG